MFQLFLNVFVHTMKLSGIENNPTDFNRIEKKIQFEQNFHFWVLV